VEIPWLFQCVEVWEAYEKAHQAGKVKHFGFSTHKHQKEVLAAAAVANGKGPWKVDLIMPGVNPVTFDEWRSELDALRKQDVGVVAMKTAAIKGREVGGKLSKLKGLMNGAEYNEWERCKLYMLHLTDKVVDACIAATGTSEQMERNAALPSVKMSSAAARELRAIVKLEMAGACHLCGNCETTCPEHIAVTDMVRYHAYIHQYNEKDLARELYRQAGYDPAKVCSNCGKCADACSSGVPITTILHQLSVAMG
jgi:predicted aldo/keto reductase-like oxidoreductase